VVAEDVLDERRVDVREPAAAVLLRPRHADPACLSERPRDLTGVAVGEHPLPAPLRIGGQLRAQLAREGGRFVAQRDLLVGEPEVHARRS
jgi:hypothetical protein